MDAFELLWESESLKSYADAVVRVLEETQNSSRKRVVEDLKEYREVLERRFQVLDFESRDKKCDDDLGGDNPLDSLRQVEN